MTDVGKAIIVSVPTALYERIHQAMRDEGIEPTRETVHSWIISALTFTAACSSTEGYRRVCSILRDANLTDPQHHTPAPPGDAPGKDPRSG